VIIDGASNSEAFWSDSNFPAIAEKLIGECLQRTFHGLSSSRMPELCKSASAASEYALVGPLPSRTRTLFRIPFRDLDESRES